MVFGNESVGARFEQHTFYNISTVSHSFVTTDDEGKSYRCSANVPGLKTQEKMITISVTGELVLLQPLSKPSLL